MSASTDLALCESDFRATLNFSMRDILIHLYGGVPYSCQATLGFGTSRSIGYSTFAGFETASSCIFPCRKIRLGTCRQQFDSIVIRIENYNVSTPSQSSISRQERLASKICRLPLTLLKVVCISKSKQLDTKVGN